MAESLKAILVTDQVRLCEAITEAMRAMDRYPNESAHEIWNKALESWGNRLRMNNDYTIDPKL